MEGGLAVSGGGDVEGTGGTEITSLMLQALPHMQWLSLGGLGILLSLAPPFQACTRWQWQSVPSRELRDPSWHGQPHFQCLANCLLIWGPLSPFCRAGRTPEEVMGGLGCILTLTEFQDDDV